MQLADLETIELALAEGRIDEAEAERLIDDLEFEDRVKDIFSWGRYYFPDKFTSGFCEEFHGYLWQIAYEPLTSTLGPRGNAKTTIQCFLIPIFTALNHPDMFHHYLNIQATSEKAVSVNVAIKTEIEQNELLKRDYGNLRGEETWTEKKFVLSNGVIFSAKGAGESIRGVNHRNKRPDYIIADDLYDDDIKDNPRLVQKITDWFWSSVYKSRSIDRVTAIKIQGTAVNKLDLMHTLANTPDCIFKRFQSYDPETNIPLWPQVNSYESLMKEKAKMGSTIFAREMQNDLRDDATSIIKERDIQYFSGDIPSGETILERLGGVDPAEKTKSHNDFTGKIATFKTNLQNFYIVDAKNDKLSQHQNLVDLENWHTRLSFTTVLFETNKAFGLFEETRRVTGVPLREVIASKDKLSRLIGVQSKFENRKVFISLRIPEPIRRELVEQLINNNPVHDDLRDAAILTLEDHARDLFVY